MKFNPLHKAFSCYFSKSTLSYWSVLAMDCLILVSAGLLAYVINHGAVATVSVFVAVMCSLLFLPVFIVCFSLFRTYIDIIILIPEACMFVLEAGSLGKGVEIFVFDMDNPVKIADLAVG